MKRFIVLETRHGWGDYPEVEIIEITDDWLDAVKKCGYGDYIIDTETGVMFDQDDNEVAQAKKVFAWYMHGDDYY